MKDCVSLEVAKKLQKAGYRSKCERGYTEGSILLPKGSLQEWVDGLELIPAPTAVQLADELPLQYITIEKHSNDYRVGETGKTHFVTANTLPDALGLMMVYLLENKIQ